MKIIHLSDLHFGTEIKSVVTALAKTIKNISPDLVITSGDLTQNGSRSEFEAASQFLTSLEVPLMTVPGNHDVPRYNLWERFTAPFKRFRHFLDNDLRPTLTKGQWVIAGLNSARAAVPHWNWANGAISKSQLNHLRTLFSNSRKPFRMCVFHHPVHQIEIPVTSGRVFGGKSARRAMETFEVDLVLTGHWHRSSVIVSGDTHKTAYVNASTALSTRQRGEGNGFNLLEVKDHHIHVQQYEITEGTFRPTLDHQITLGNNGVLSKTTLPQKAVG